jgi:hypothetical protein
MRRALVLVASIGALGCDAVGDLGDSGVVRGGDGGGEAESGIDVTSSTGDEPDAPSDSESTGLPSDGEDSGTTTGFGRRDNPAEPAWCDPLQQDCPGVHTCIWDDDQFRCTLDLSGGSGAAGDPCASIGGCDPGLFCGGENMCTSWCDASQVPGPCGSGECLPFFPSGEAPPGLAHVGYCG